MTWRWSFWRRGVSPRQPVNVRLCLCAAGLCLPTVLVVLLGVFFLVDRVPDIIRNEHRRVLNEYRAVAQDLKNGSETGFPVTRGKGGGWNKDHRMAPGFWGVVPDVGREVVIWYMDAKGACVGKRIPAIDEVDFGFIFWCCGSFVLALLIALTGVGVRYFVNYVKSRDDFLAATAHDLTTPLVGMRYTIGKNDTEAAKLNERMIRLVENIKDFLKLGGRRPAPRREAVDLVACFAEAYALFREDYRDLFDGKDVELDCGGEGAPAPCACGDTTLVIQILWNLLGNDLKYAAPYGAVRARLSTRDRFVVFELVDEGKGMTPRERRRAFDRYYRAKTVLESGKGGFGIGLCTAREFAVAMGGTLTVGPNAPHGCVFTLTLPRMCYNTSQP